MLPHRLSCKITMDMIFAPITYPRLVLLTIASLRGGSLFATDIEQMGAYNGYMETVSVSISKRRRKQRIGQKRDGTEIGEERQEGAEHIRSHLRRGVEVIVDLRTDVTSGARSPEVFHKKELIVGAVVSHADSDLCVG
jgi:hypothetical protein